MRHVTVRRPGATSTPKPRGASSSSSTSSTPRSSKRLVTRQLLRAADDGYRNPLVPGLKATADAERLAVALTQARIRLLPPGPYPLIADEPDLEQAEEIFITSTTREVQAVERIGTRAVPLGPLTRRAAGVFTALVADYLGSRRQETHA